MAPVIQCFALTVTPAATASLLLNFEIVATVLLAFLVFHEPADKKTGLALILIFAGSILLGWNGESTLGFSLGALGIILSRVFLGHGQQLHGAYLGLLPGSDRAVQGDLWREHCRDPRDRARGAPTRGRSDRPCPFYRILLLWVSGSSSLSWPCGTWVRHGQGRSIRQPPFIGCIASLFIFSDALGSQFWLAVPLFVAGALIVIREQWKLGYTAGAGNETAGNPLGKERQHNPDAAERKKVRVDCVLRPDIPAALVFFLGSTQLVDGKLRVT